MYKRCNGTVKASIPPGTCQYEPTQSTSIHTPPHTHTHLRRHGVGGFDSDSLNSPTAPPHTETHRPQISRRTPCAELALVQAAAHTKVVTPLRQCPSSVSTRPLRREVKEREVVPPVQLHRSAGKSFSAKPAIRQAARSGHRTYALPPASLLNTASPRRGTSYRGRCRQHRPTDPPGSSHQPSLSYAKRLLQR